MTPKKAKKFVNFLIGSDEKFTKAFQLFEKQRYFQHVINNSIAASNQIPPNHEDDEPFRCQRYSGFYVDPGFNPEAVVLVGQDPEGQDDSILYEFNFNGIFNFDEWLPVMEDALDELRVELMKRTKEYHEKVAEYQLYVELDEKYGAKSE